MPNVRKTLEVSLNALKNDPKKISQLLSKDGYSKIGRVLFRKKKNKQQIEKEKIEKKIIFQSNAWEHHDSVSYRRHEDYEAYIKQQKGKLENLLKTTDFTRNEKTKINFRKRFELVTQIPANASVLCLAARVGSEVEAFIEMGHFALGIDLNPGPENPYVVVGDFHKLVFASNSVDVVYTNSLDHAFDVEKIAQEVSRVLKPDGIFILEAVYGYEEGYIAGGHDVTHWPTVERFAQKVAKSSGLTLIEIRDLNPTGTELFKQCVFQKV